MEKISWNTIEYLHKEKTSDWYWIVGIVTISIALISIILNNIIFAILIIVSSFTLSLFASKKPESITVDINDIGITVGKNSYPYKDLDSFWIETHDSYPRILLKSKKVFMPFVVVLIENIESEKIHEFLLKHLPEEEHTEPLLEKLLLYFGF
ncbi:MAG: hypothetical protein NTX96_02520 [Candidatus Zambryskibacteria bacterium]|nr:hypothetical protein [Candidatus Zambryskibacteria bacterium]